MQNQHLSLNHLSLNEGGHYTNVTHYTKVATCLNHLSLNEGGHAEEEIVKAIRIESQSPFTE